MEKNSEESCQIKASILEDMGNAIISRGPDYGGIWCDESGIAFAHRRLSILDLSPAGRQPMYSSSGRYIITFNGEIYNHLELRKELKNEKWQGHSDTETLLGAFEEWGIETTLKKTVGMFAIALWDHKTRQLTLARDRLGEKPLYYGWQGSGGKAAFLFSSELKALKVHPAFSGEINRDAVCLLMRHNYIPAPHSIYRGIYKLEPGTFLTISPEKIEPVVQTYWSIESVSVSGSRNPFLGTSKEAVDCLDILLKCAVRQQMRADVPLGAFLSGGIDSSTIVALMQAQSGQPVKSFSIGFNEESYNEAVHAKAVARHLGTDHTELYVTSKQAMDVIPNLPRLYCEPFSDSSQIPTFLLSQLARQKVTVSLSGDAGDELFAGYNRYVLAQNFWGKISGIPLTIRSMATASIRSVTPATWNRLPKFLQLFGFKKSRFSNLGEKLHKAAQVLCAQSINELYLGLVTHWVPHDLVLGGKEPETYLRGKQLKLEGLNDVQRMMAMDSLTYLPDDILCKIDRAAMGVSLESRVPFLDHRVVEFAWRIPQSMKLRGKVGKWILRQVLQRYVPKELVERPKMGFGVPIDSWLRGPLKDWAEAQIDKRRLCNEGYFDAEKIRKKWKEHLSGKSDWQYHLWDVLMFQAWLAYWKK